MVLETRDSGGIVWAERSIASVGGVGGFGDECGVIFGTEVTMRRIGLGMVTEFGNIPRPLKVS